MEFIKESDFKQLLLVASEIMYCQAQSEETEIYNPEEVQYFKGQVTAYKQRYNALLEALKL